MIFFILKEETTKTRKDKKKKSNLIFNSFSFKTALFEHILKKSAHSFYGAWSFLLVHIRFTSNEEPKDFVN